MSQQRARGNHVQVPSEAVRKTITSENGTIRLTPHGSAPRGALLNPVQAREVTEDQLHRTLQNRVLGEDLEDAASPALPRRRQAGLVPEDVLKEQQPPPRPTRHGHPHVLVNPASGLLLRLTVRGDSGTSHLMSTQLG